MASRDLIKPIEIQHLRDLQRALKDGGEGAQKKLRVVFNEAAETVIGGARSRVPRGDTGKARASLKPRSGQREAMVVGGGNKAPYFGFLEFGNKVHGGHGVGRGDSVPRKFVQGGRYIYPSWAANRKSILVGLADALTELARESGLEVD